MAKGRGGKQPVRPAAVEPKPASPKRIPRWLFAPEFAAEFSGLPSAAISGLSTLMERHAQGTTRPGNHFKPIGDGLYELRFEHSNNHFRLIFKWDEGDLVALTAFAKNQEKIPRKDLKRAQTRSAAWLRPEDAGSARSKNPETNRGSR